MDILKDALKNRGVLIIAESFKVDENIEPAFKDAEAWGLRVAEALKFV